MCIEECHKFFSCQRKTIAPEKSRFQGLGRKLEITSQEDSSDYVEEQGKDNPFPRSSDSLLNRIKKENLHKNIQFCKISYNQQKGSRMSLLLFCFLLDHHGFSDLGSLYVLGCLG